MKLRLKQAQCILMLAGISLHVSYVYAENAKTTEAEVRKTSTLSSASDAAAAAATAATAAATAAESAANAANAAVEAINAVLPPSQRKSLTKKSKSTPAKSEIVHSTDSPAITPVKPNGDEMQAKESNLPEMAKANAVNALESKFSVPLDRSLIGLVGTYEIAVSSDLRGAYARGVAGIQDENVCLLYTSLDSIRSIAQGWVGKALLALITIPFALFGIDSYLRDAGSNVAVAKVGGNNITIQEYDNALKNIRNRLQSEGKIDPAQPDSQEMKALVLNQLINKQLLNDELKHAKYAISDTQLATYITGMPEFQKEGKFSQEQYDQLLAQNQYTPKKFEESMRADLLAQQAQDGIAKLGFVTNARAEQAFKLTNQQRVVTVAEIKTKDFVNQVKVDPVQVKAYYEQHKAKLMNPEQVKIEFLLMSATNLITGVSVSDAEVRKFYDENADKFSANEQRSASHILIGFGVNPTPEKKLEAKAKTEGILAEIKKNPKSFEALAAKHSQDEGSAVKGGDLGSFGRGAMVKPFEDAAFSMKVNEVSDLVESEFGYHIIKVTGITGQNNDCLLYTSRCV